MNILPYQVALHHIGTKEVSGKNHNTKIIQWFNDMGFDGSKMGDETSWCSLFTNWCCKVSGYQYTGKLWARSWSDFPGVKEVNEENVELGDIVVFWRGDYNGDPISGTNIPKGHVGFFMNIDQDKRFINVLGGNQSNQVKVSKYYASRLIGYYRPILQASL